MQLRIPRCFRCRAAQVFILLQAQIERSGRKKVQVRIWWVQFLFEPDGCAISKFLNIFRTQSTVYCGFMFSGICRVDVQCISKYHLPKWWASHSYGLDLFCVVLSACDLYFYFWGGHSSVKVSESFTIVSSSAFGIKLWPPKISKSLILFLANYGSNRE